MNMNDKDNNQKSGAPGPPSFGGEKPTPPAFDVGAKPTPPPFAGARKVRPLPLLCQHQRKSRHSQQWRKPRK